MGKEREKAEEMGKKDAGSAENEKEKRKRRRTREDKITKRKGKTKDRKNDGVKNREEAWKSYGK